ncbi:hypothetical protein GGR52DRAFT_520366 [Hypoxylon sp. FL1284]|nr:hypothetical protein GGR52DRAFT_520366 [Hypoxylon sp. FL1284]
MSRPMRSSCDRCHSQKLKCPKQPGLPTCTRCLRAGAACVFSPAGLPARRPIPSPPCLDDDTAMQLDWASLSWDTTLGPPPEATPEFRLDGPQLSGQADIVEKDERAKSVRHLTTLAAEIDQVSIDISSIAQTHVSRNQPIDCAHSSLLHSVTSHNCVEQLFTLAQRLVDLYPPVLKILSGGPKASECKNPDCFHTVELPGDLEKCFPVKDDPDDIDSFLFNLVVLCHTKVLDVMGSLMISAKTCTQITWGSPDLRKVHAYVPEVRVGSFVATSNAASSMQAALILHIASVLLDYARKLSKDVATVADRNRKNKQNQILKLQCEQLEEKAVSSMDLLGNVKGVLTKLGCVKQSLGTD